MADNVKPVETDLPEQGTADGVDEIDSQSISVKDEVQDGAVKETPDDKSGQPEKGKSDGKKVPLEALKNVRQEKKRIQTDYNKLAQAYSELTGSFPGMAPAPRPSGVAPGQQPHAGQYLPPPSAARTDSIPQIDPDAPLTAGEVQTLLQSAVQDTETRIHDQYRQENTGLKLQIAHMEGAIEHGKEKWSEITSMAEEVAEAYPEYVQQLAAQGLRAPLRVVIETLAKLHPEYDAGVEQRATERVVGNIKTQLGKPRTATGVAAGSPVSAWEKYKANKGKLSLDESIKLVDEALSQG